MSEPIRPRLAVAHFTNSQTRGGAEEHILTLLRGFDRATFDLSLICPAEVADKLGSDLPHDVSVHRLLLRHPLDVRNALRLARTLRGRVDIVHSHLFYSSLFASPVAWLAGVPLIVETPHVREHWRKGPIKSRFFVDRFVGRFVDRYIAVSEANARYLVETKGLPPTKVTVIQNGCDITRFDPTRPPPAGLRAGLGISPDDPLVVVVGRLEPQKGHAVLLEALARVTRQEPRVRLVCVGEGSLRSELEDRVRGLGVVANVRFVGFQSHVEDWLALADFTVLPSLWEGLPLAAIESLAAGRTMVATRVDGTVEVVVEGETGLTVPPGEAAPLAEALLRLLREPQLRNRLAARGRAWVTERFTQERQVEQTQDLYIKAWEASRRRAGQAVTKSPASAA
jgi:glycosyltransferase involved in cell wall biosynthesis